MGKVWQIFLGPTWCKRTMPAIFSADFRDLRQGLRRPPGRLGRCLLGQVARPGSPPFEPGAPRAGRAYNVSLTRTRSGSSATEARSKPSSSHSLSMVAFSRSTSPKISPMPRPRA